MKLKCLQCGNEFDGEVERDYLGFHSTCPKCGGSFDVEQPFNVWENLGDINFLSYGGCLVRKIGDNSYDVLHVYAPCDLGEDITEGKDIYLAMLHMVVEPKDFEEKKLEILTLIGEEDKADLPMFEIMDGALWAKEIVEAGEHDIWYNYQGHCYDGENRVEFMDLLKWLKELEVPVDILGADEETAKVYIELQQN